MKKRTVSTYALGHFLVDFSCAFLLISTSPTPWLYIVYNFCAFALQMPIGLLADIIGFNQRMSIWGVSLVFAAYLPFPIPIRVLLLGVGNACYHVGGGREALLSDKRLLGLGIFVSPGAIGILLGSLCSNVSIFAQLVPTALLLLIGSILAFCPNKRSLICPGKSNGWNCFLMFLVVLARSFVGLCMQTPWKTDVFISLAGIASAAGKFLGGMMADRFGSKLTGVASLSISALLFCVPDLVITGILGCLFFNMTMPITLRSATDAIPGFEGFSFGLLTFALFLGYLPTATGFTISPWLGAGISILSAVLLLFLREKSHD
jgi:FSR family fosmidomycin resistance protein-like MFS transporter